MHAKDFKDVSASRHTSSSFVFVPDCLSVLGRLFFFFAFLFTSLFFRQHNAQSVVTAGTVSGRGTGIAGAAFFPEKSSPEIKTGPSDEKKKNEIFPEHVSPSLP
jgi:hypothetical protein